MDLLQRDRWGARPPKSVTTITTPTSKLVLHHGATPGEGPERVRSYQRYHMDARGYVDIAYNWLADRTYGYVGRGAGVQGGHTKGHNASAHAVCAVGDYSTVDPPDGLLDNLAALAVHAWREGAVERPAYTHGHRDLGPTSCPGDRLYAALPEINRRAARLAEGDTVKTYAQCVVGRTDADLEAGRVLAVGYDIALVRAVAPAKIVGEWPHPGVEARGQFGICVGSAPTLVGPDDFPEGGLVIAGADRNDTARKIAQVLFAFPPDSIARRGKPW